MFKHYTDAVETIKSLKKSKRYDELEKVLLWCVEATEKESKSEGLGVAPYYYDELAKLYRRQKNYQEEYAVLERFARQRHSRGVKTEDLLGRLERARTSSSEPSNHK
jgi:hypothetical protein